MGEYGIELLYQLDGSGIKGRGGEVRKENGLGGPKGNCIQESEQGRGPAASFKGKPKDIVVGRGGHGQTKTW